MYPKMLKKLPHRGYLSSLAKLQPIIISDAEIGHGSETKKAAVVSKIRKSVQPNALQKLEEEDMDILVPGAESI